MTLKEKLGKLNEIVALAREKSPFYTGHLPKIEIRTRDDLYQIPFLEKGHINQHSLPQGHDLFTGPLENCIVIASSGSTGERKYTIIERAVWLKAMQFQEMALRHLGLGTGDTMAILSAAAPFDPTLPSLVELVFRLGCVVLPVTGNTDIDSIIDYLVTFKPNAAYAVPSFILRIAERIQERGVSVRLDKFFYVGEHMGRDAEKRVRSVLGCREIYAVGYTTADTGILGIQDLATGGATYHAVEDFHFIEILDPETGRDAQTGEVGEIVVSSYDRKLFPLIRFRTGDYGYWLDPVDNAPELGRRLVLLGRGDDEIMIRAMGVPTGLFVESVRGCSGFSGVMQIVISMDQGLTTIDVQAECSNPTAMADDTDQVRRHILAGNEPLRHEIEDEKVAILKVTPVLTGTLPTTFSGKVRLVRDCRVE